MTGKAQPPTSGFPAGSSVLLGGIIMVEEIEGRDKKGVSDPKITNVDLRLGKPQPSEFAGTSFYWIGGEASVLAERMESRDGWLIRPGVKPSGSSSPWTHPPVVLFFHQAPFPSTPASDIASGRRTASLLGVRLLDGRAQDREVSNEQLGDKGDKADTGIRGIRRIKARNLSTVSSHQGEPATCQPIFIMVRT